MLNDQQFYLFGKIQTRLRESHLYSDTSHYYECSLGEVIFLGYVKISIM